MVPSSHVANRRNVDFKTPAGVIGGCQDTRFMSFGDRTFSGRSRMAVVNYNQFIGGGHREPVLSCHTSCTHNKTVKCSP